MISLKYIPYRYLDLLSQKETSMKLLLDVKGLKFIRRKLYFVMTITTLFRAYLVSPQICIKGFDNKELYFFYMHKIFCLLSSLTYV